MLQACVWVSIQTWEGFSAYLTSDAFKASRELYVGEAAAVKKKAMRMSAPQIR